MGLPLHNSADALNLLSHGPSQATPGWSASSRARTREPSNDSLPLLDVVLLANHKRQTRRHRQTRPRHSHRSTNQWLSKEAAEGRELAALGCFEPSGGGDLTRQRRRTPSLERQGAFRESRTTKDRHDGGEACHDQEDADGGGVAELYRLGLLYDDEHLRGSGFALDAIVHRHGEPEYTVRPAKRVRRGEAQRRRQRRRRRCSYEDELQLALDISLAELGRDESFARYLLSPDLDENVADVVVEEPDPSPRLAPLRFVSEAMMNSPSGFDYASTPDLTTTTTTTTTTTDSDSDQASFSCFSEDESWAAVRPTGGRMRRSRRGTTSAQSEASADAWMMVGDGS